MPRKATKVKVSKVEPIESKNDRFCRVIEPRLKNALRYINMCAFGADRTRYEPTETNVIELEAALTKAIADMIELYRAKIRVPGEFHFTREGNQD